MIYMIRSCVIACCAKTCAYKKNNRLFSSAFTMASTAVQGGMNQGWFVGAPVTKIVAFTAAITFALIESRKVDNSLAVGEW